MFNNNGDLSKDSLKGLDVMTARTMNDILRVADVYIFIYRPVRAG